MGKRFWVAFFSQTGSEIVEVSKKIGRWPDLIVTNRQDMEGVNPELVKYVSMQDQKYFYRQNDRLCILPVKPKMEDYQYLIDQYFPIKSMVNNDIFITLHGYLRILPGEFCERFLIYNGHPGRIWVDESLKGFNPQEKAFNKGDKIGGSVIHLCTATVDSGDIVAKRECSLEGKDLDGVYKALHDNSITLWIDFLKDKLQ